MLYYAMLYHTIPHCTRLTIRYTTQCDTALYYNTMLHYDTLHHTTLDYAALLEQRPAARKST